MAGSTSGNNCRLAPVPRFLPMSKARGIRAAVSVIGSGEVIDPSVLLAEMAELAHRGPQRELSISPRAHLIMPYHRDKVRRTGIRVGDLLDREE